MVETARDIFQRFLDETGRLMKERNFATLSTMMIYPLRLETSDGSLTNMSPDEFITSAEAFAAYLDNMGAQDFLRIAKDAQFVDDTRQDIDGQHETFILKGGTYVVDPYRNALRLKLLDGVWRGAHFRSQVSNITVPLLNPAQLREHAVAKLEQLTKAKPNDGLHDKN